MESGKMNEIPGIRFPLLHRLARLHGVEACYRDHTGRRRCAAPHILLAALQALGAPVENISDLPDAFRARVREKWQRCCEPVAVVWEGSQGHLNLRLPATQTGCQADCILELENGETRRWRCRPVRLPLLAGVSVEGVKFERRRLLLPPGLPLGYHRLTLCLPARTEEALIISAPRRAYDPTDGATASGWGVFLPLYALHSGRSWGSGDLTDLAALLNWLKSLGGDMAGALPLLAAFLDEPFAPGPYEPVSRLFWNEFYLDVERVEELKRSPEALDLLNSPEFRAAMEALRGSPLVDYSRGMALKRQVLEHCVRTCFAGGSNRQAALRRWVAENPAALDYARFRAVVERRRAGWPAWPERMRDGILREGDYDPEAARYHLYVQWLAAGQFREIAAMARENGQRLYLDLPVGVHGAGYDVWRERAVFAMEACAGAPPDAFFSGGQNWGFPPLHPERLREQGYRYFIACLRHHLRHAGILRLDHVMGLHRLYWVPRGLPAREGVYVRYHAEEFYAVLALESRRRQALLVGEDLGVVPGYIRAAMERHGIHRMYVLPFETTGNPRQALRPAPAVALASLNTHDMPPFASFWLKQRRSDRAVLPVFLYRQGLLGVPTNKAGPVRRACLAHLAAGRARFLQVNLEDLWLETAPQNVPGTTEEYPNWRRKARLSLEDFTRDPSVLEILGEINQLRKARGKAILSRPAPSPPAADFFTDRG